MNIISVSKPVQPTSDEGDDRPKESPPPFQWNIFSGSDVWTGDADEIARLSDKPIIEGLLREREVATVVGAAKTAKTWFTLAMALAVANGDEFLGMETHQRKTLYLDYELKDGTFRKRLSLLSPDRPDGFFYQCLRGQSRLPSVAEIADLVIAQGFGLVVVDSLYRTGWLSEENNNDTVSRELSGLQDFTRRTACSLVCVDHTAKGGGNERSAVDAARGASAKGGFYDALLVLRPTDKGPDQDATYCILDPVLRDWPRIQELPLVSFAWTATSCIVESAGTVAPGESDANATRILEVIAANEAGISIKGIVMALKNVSEPTVRRGLEALTAKDKVIEFPDPTHKQRKFYRMPDIADEPRQTSPNPIA